MKGDHGNFNGEAAHHGHEYPQLNAPPIVEPIARLLKGRLHVCRRPCELLNVPGQLSIESIDTGDQLRNSEGKPHVLARVAGPFDLRHNQGNAENTQKRKEAACQRVNKELACRILSLWTTPDADDEEQGYKGQLKEHVKEYHVE